MLLDCRFGISARSARSADYRNSALPVYREYLSLADLQLENGTLLEKEYEFAQRSHDYHAVISRLHCRYALLTAAFETAHPVLFFDHSPVLIAECDESEGDEFEYSPGTDNADRGS